MASADRAAALVELLVCCEAAQLARIPWWQVSRSVESAGSVRALLEGPWEPKDRWEYEVAVALARHYSPEHRQRWEEALADWLRMDPELRFITIVDREYPLSLRLVFNPPPFIVTRGALTRGDSRGVAVVGTRRPSREGLAQAYELGAQLADAGITVFSGLALGIDTAAHRGALDAGGRTVAVLGHGLLRPTYPRANETLAGEIVDAGALVSQFRPDTPPSRSTFPMRNAVTSGLSQGTAVVEAAHTSGARMQARLALEQGKRVWLLSHLVTRFPWAREFASRDPERVRVVSEVSEVTSELLDERELAASVGDELPAVPEVEQRRRPRAKQPALFAPDRDVEWPAD